MFFLIWRIYVYSRVAKTLKKKKKIVIVTDFVLIIGQNTVLKEFYDFIWVKRKLLGTDTFLTDS